MRPIDNRKEGMADLRIGTSWTHSGINIMERTSDEIVGKLDSNIYKSEMGRISSEFPDPSRGYLLGSAMGYQKRDLIGGRFERSSVCRPLWTE